MGSRSVLSCEEAAYIAGFLDGDGAISAKVGKYKTTWSGYRVRVVVSFTQKTGNRYVLDVLRSRIGHGRKVVDYPEKGLSEYVISDRSEVKDILGKVTEFLVLKKSQAVLSGRIIGLLEAKRGLKNAISRENFIGIIKLAQEIRALNSGTGLKRTHNLQEIAEQI